MRRWVLKTRSGPWSILFFFSSSLVFTAFRQPSEFFEEVEAGVLTISNHLLCGFFILRGLISALGLEGTRTLISQLG